MHTRRTSHLIVMLDPQAKLGQKNVSLCHSIQKTIYENLLEKQFGQSGGYLVFVLTCRDIVTVDRLRSVMIMGIRAAWLASYQHFSQQQKSGRHRQCRLLVCLVCTSTTIFGTYDIGNNRLSSFYEVILL